MKKTTLIALLAAACSASAAGDGFGVYLFTTFGAPGAKSWSLSLPGGGSETIALEAAPVLDAGDIATADAERDAGGQGAIRLVLTPGGATKLAEVTSRSVGRRLGIVVAGRLRAAPHVLAGITNGVLVVGGLKPDEAEALAKSLRPPAAPVRTGPVTMTVAGANSAALRDLDGTWSLLNATVNARHVPDAKFSSGTWVFRDGTLAATNATGEAGRFRLGTDAAVPGAVHLEPIAPSKERGGWILVKRDGDRLLVAVMDDLGSRPESFEPGEKKLILKFSRGTRGGTRAACEILTAAGILSLLPGGVRDPERERGGGGGVCVFTDPVGRDVTLAIVPGAEQANFDAEAENLGRNGQFVFRKEPQLGNSAVSASKGYYFVVLALERDALVTLAFKIPGHDTGAFLAFARRVLAKVRG